MNTALLVIDMQVGVMADCFERDETLVRTEVLVFRARAAGIPVVWIQDCQDFARYSADWQLAPPLEPLRSEARVSKDYRDAFVETNLATILTRTGVGRLLIAGAQSDFCVRTAAQRAAAEGYDVTLIGDCHTTRDVQIGNSTVFAGQIIEQTNQYFYGLRYPGQTFTVINHDEPLID